MDALSTSRPLPHFDCFDPDYRSWGRYARVAQLRENDPPVAVDPLGRTWLFRYEDVFATLLNSRGTHAVETMAATLLGFDDDGPFHRWQDNVVITQNPPKHTRLRKATAYFGMHQLKPLLPTIRAACHELIDAFPQDGVVDFRDEFAFKLPVGVIMRMLNLPVEDQPIIRELSPRIVPHGATDEIRASVEDAHVRMRGYAERVMEERRRNPIEGDIITGMLAAQDAGDLTHDEVWSQIVALIVAGHETTTSALGLGVYTMLQHRDQLERLKADRSLAANAAAEILRFEPPQDHIQRLVEQPFERHGRTFEPGSAVLVSLAAANHDPREFPDPGRFDIQRENANRHLAFGGGIHRCLGAPLAGLELQVALDVLLDRLESFELAEEPELATTGFFRGFAELPLRVKRRS